MYVSKLSANVFLNFTKLESHFLMPFFNTWNMNEMIYANKTSPIQTIFLKLFIFIFVADNKTIAALGSGSFCAPQKFPVTIPSDIHVNIFPNTVDLNRCSGYTYSSRTHCVATAKERVNVSYMMFLHSGQRVSNPD